jgi:hypothetical protein
LTCRYTRILLVTVRHSHSAEAGSPVTPLDASMYYSCNYSPPASVHALLLPAAFHIISLGHLAMQCPLLFMDHSPNHCKYGTQRYYRRTLHVASMRCCPDPLLMILGKLVERGTYSCEPKGGSLKGRVVEQHDAYHHSD